MAMRGYRPSDLYSLLKKHGWYIRNRNSSHVTMTKEGNEKIITIVDNNNKEICRPLCRRLLKDAGLLHML